MVGCAANFTHNIAARAGGLAIVGAGTATVTDTSFTANSALNSTDSPGGGALLLAGGGGGSLSVNMRRVVLDSNRARVGGSVAAASVHVNFTDVDGTHSRASSEGGFLSMADGAFVRVKRCHFVGNTAGMSGGVFVVDDTSHAASGELVVEDSVFEHSQAGANGGVLAVATAVDSLVVTFNNTWFLDNRAADLGGTGWVQQDGEVDFYNCTFLRGTSGGSGGVLALPAAVSARLRRCEISKSSASFGAVVAVRCVVVCDASLH